MADNQAVPTEQELSDFLDQGGGLASTAKSRGCPKCREKDARIAELEDQLKDAKAIAALRHEQTKRRHES